MPRRRCEVRLVTHGYVADTYVYRESPWEEETAATKRHLLRVARTQSRQAGISTAVERLCSIHGTPHAQFVCEDGRCRSPKRKR